MYFRQNAEYSDVHLQQLVTRWQIVGGIPEPIQEAIALLDMVAVLPGTYSVNHGTEQTVHSSWIPMLGTVHTAEKDGQREYGVLASYIVEKLGVKRLVVEDKERRLREEWNMVALMNAP